MKKGEIKVNEALFISIRRLRAKGNSLKEIAKRYNISVSKMKKILTIIVMICMLASCAETRKCQPMYNNHKSIGY